MEVNQGWLVSYKVVVQEAYRAMEVKQDFLIEASGCTLRYIAYQDRYVLWSSTDDALRKAMHKINPEESGFVICSGRGAFPEEQSYGFAFAMIDWDHMCIFLKYYYSDDSD